MQKQTCAVLTTVTAPPQVAVVKTVAFNQYHNATHSFVTRHALALSPTPTWANSGLQSATTINGFDSYSVQSPTGDVTVSNSPTGFSTATDFFGHATSSASGTLDAFGAVTSSLATGLGATPTGIAGTAATDALGRVTAETAIGGATSAESGYTWQGPQSVTAPDGSITSYTYTPWGQIQTETVANPSGGTVTTTFGYDAAGNVVSAATVGGGLTVTATADFDAQGRMTSSTDAMGRHTTVAYTPSAQGTTVTTTTTAAPSPTPTSGPTSSTEVDSFYLDGSPRSVSGSATTPSVSDEGVDPATGDTWSQSGTPDGQDWTRVYTNLLGQQYKTVYDGMLKGFAWMKKRVQVSIPIGAGGMADAGGGTTRAMRAWTEH